jgi:hypothetical protein
MSQIKENSAPVAKIRQFRVLLKRAVASRSFTNQRVALNQYIFGNFIDRELQVRKAGPRVLA